MVFLDFKLLQKKMQPSRNKMSHEIKENASESVQNLKICQSVH